MDGCPLPGDENVKTVPVSDLVGLFLGLKHPDRLV
jgi:hypothetical protein